MKVADEKTTRQSYLELSIKLGCEREYLKIVDETDKKLLICQDPSKRSDIAKVGIMRIDNLFRWFGSKGNLVVDNQILIEER